MAREHLTVLVGIILNHLIIHSVGIILILCLVLLAWVLVWSGLLVHIQRWHRHILQLV